MGGWQRDRYTQISIRAMQSLQPFYCMLVDVDSSSSSTVQYSTVQRNACFGQRTCAEGSPGCFFFFYAFCFLLSQGLGRGVSMKFGFEIPPRYCVRRWWERLAPCLPLSRLGRVGGWVGGWVMEEAGRQTHALLYTICRSRGRVCAVIRFVRVCSAVSVSVHPRKDTVVTLELDPSAAETATASSLPGGSSGAWGCRPYFTVQLVQSRAFCYLESYG